jgi:hypothetical protein
MTKAVERNEKLVSALMFQIAENFIFTSVQQKYLTITQICNPSY